MASLVIAKLEIGFERLPGFSHGFISIPSGWLEVTRLFEIATD
jgi:hypothetical protein